jgi:hypothetical protein
MYLCAENCDRASLSLRLFLMIPNKAAVLLKALETDCLALFQTGFSKLERCVPQVSESWPGAHCKDTVRGLERPENRGELVVRLADAAARVLVYRRARATAVVAIELPEGQ